MDENEQTIHHKNAFWNWISIALVCVGALAGALATNGKLTGGQCGDWGMNCLVLGVLVFFGACVLGFIAAISAFIRHEKLQALTWIGLILNGLVIVAVIVMYFMITFR
jgi:hypothetical protein